MTLEERLNQIIEEKDSEIERLASEINELKTTSNFARLSWQMQSSFQNVGVFSKLPYPRLEMRLEKTSQDWYRVQWIYGLVVKHYVDVDNDTLIFMPFSMTTSNGGSRQIESWIRGGKIELPYRDGVHIQADAMALNFPAFIVCYETGEFNEIEINKEFLSQYVKRMISVTVNNQ